MPNLKGGKKYRSGKHTDEKSEFHEISEGQSVGRVLKHLGDRNVLLYCNNGKECTAHIRGGLSKKKATIEIGDIVLYSNRGEELGSLSGSKARADIIAKYNHDTHHDLKKINGINPRIFMQLERADTATLDKINNADEAFEFDVGSDSDSDSESENEENEEERRMKKLQEDANRSSARNTKYSQKEEELNIDDI